MQDSNVELQLKALNGESVELPKPRSRVELFLAKLNGESVDLPEPQSRVEELLYKLCQKSGDDGSSAFVDALIRSLKMQTDVDIVLPAKFDSITSIPDDYTEFYLPINIRSLSSETAKVILPKFCTITTVESVNCPMVTIVGEQAFYQCENLTDVHMPLLERADAEAFSMCNNLESLILPSLQIVGSNLFKSATVAGVKLKTFKAGVLTETQSDSFKLGNRNNPTIAKLSVFEVGEGTSADLYLQYSEAYTQEVLHNIITNLADLTGRATPGEFCVGDTNLEKISAEYKTILEHKNWNYS